MHSCCCYASILILNLSLLIEVVLLPKVPQNIDKTFWGMRSRGGGREEALQGGSRGSKVPSMRHRWVLVSGSILLTILILHGIISSDHEEQLLGFKYYCEFIQCSRLSLRWIIAVMVMLINHTSQQQPHRGTDVGHRSETLWAAWRVSITIRKQDLRCGTNQVITRHFA